MSKVVYYLTPSSFCFGVKRSIDELIKVIDHHPHDRIFCIHAVVHNPKVSKYFEDRGVQFVEHIEEVPTPDAVVVFSAHGINRQVLAEAQQRFKAVYNLECPFVSRIYTEAQTYLKQGIAHFVYIGKANHQEGKNVVEYIRSQGATVDVILSEEEIKNLTLPNVFAVLSQTTLNFAQVESLVTYIKTTYPQAVLPKISDVCRATYERQTVIQTSLDKFDTLTVIGGKESSNTKELYKIGCDADKQTFYGESLSDLLLDPNFLIQKNDRVAVTGGASTPVEDILEVLDWYEKQGYRRQSIGL